MNRRGFLRGLLGVVASLLGLSTAKTTVSPSAEAVIGDAVPPWQTAYHVMLSEFQYVHERWDKHFTINQKAMTARYSGGLTMAAVGEPSGYGTEDWLLLRNLLLRPLTVPVRDEWGDLIRLRFIPQVVHMGGIMKTVHWEANYEEVADATA